MVLADVCHGSSMEPACYDTDISLLPKNLSCPGFCWWMVNGSGIHYLAIVNAFLLDIWMSIFSTVSFHISWNGSCSCPWSGLPSVSCSIFHNPHLSRGFLTVKWTNFLLEKVGSFFSVESTSEYTNASDRFVSLTACQPFQCGIHYLSLIMWWQWPVLELS